MALPASSRPLIVTADDTTGALESASGIADRGWATAVVPHAMVADITAAGLLGPLLIDLRSRHEPPAVAAARLGSMLSELPQIAVHKIDSTLRGNWPAEIAAAVASGRRVLMVPAYPQAGRVCRDGVVTEHGVPVDQTAHARDPRAPVLTSRPATLLQSAAELSTLAQIAQWLDGSGRVAVADAADDRQLAHVVELACASDDVLLVGTAAVVATAATCLGPARMGQPVDPAAKAPIAAPVLVVCGSMHATSRAQIESLIDAGAMVGHDEDSPRPAQVTVLTSPPDRDGDPALVAVDLARRAHRALRATPVSTVVLLGGDTAEAFIGSRVVHVVGSIGVGVALGSIEIEGRRIALVAKPGAFGSANTLVDLMDDALHGADARD